MQIRMTANQALRLRPKDVNRVYNLPVGGEKIVLDKDDKTGVAEFKDSLGIGDDTDKWMVPHKSVRTALLNEDDAVKWSKLAILYILGTLLAPSTSPHISVIYHSVLDDIDQVANYDWCDHVLQHIKTGIGKKGVKSPKTDFHFLLVYIFY